MNWSDYRNFSKWEFDCKHTGENKMRPEFLELLQAIRDTDGRPVVISSGYRHWTHPREIHKENPGAHTYGVAADIKVHGIRAFELADIAFHLGIRRIGMDQRSSVPLEDRFIHLDIADRDLGFRQTVWTYP